MGDFGDRVRIKDTNETRTAGIAGLEGDVYGITTPSITNVDVIGGAPDDCALNISIEAIDETFWVRPDLVEVIHHNAGMEVVVGSVRAVRRADGTWTQSKVCSKGSGLWARVQSFLKG